MNTEHTNQSRQAEPATHSPIALQSIPKRQRDFTAENIRDIAHECMRIGDNEQAEVIFAIADALRDGNLTIHPAAVAVRIRELEAQLNAATHARQEAQQIAQEAIEARNRAGVEIRRPLLKRIRELQAQQAEPVNQQLLALVKSFGHKTGCAKNAFGELCTCGADEAIAAAEQVTLCASCARANVDCPIYPQQTASCVEHRPAAQQQAEPVACKHSPSGQHSQHFDDGDMCAHCNQSMHTIDLMKKYRNAVARDVLMAAMNDVRRAQLKIVREGLQGGRWIEDIDDAVSGIDLDAIADRYAAQPPAVAVPLSAALADIAAERRRQVEQEGWTPEHDDKYRPYVLSGAAGCYAMHTLAYPAGDPPPAWPFAASWWKPSADTRRNLVKAGALIAADIERLDRAAKKGGEA